VLLLNLDAGEYATEPDELWALADILCVACGGHAGDVFSMTHPAIVTAELGRFFSIPLSGSVKFVVTSSR
jgi:lactam utilization protein B